MESQESNQIENNSSTAVLENTETDIEITSIDNQFEVVEEKKVFPTDQDSITAIIEDAFPNKASNPQLSARQSNSFSFVGRIFFLWVWPIVLHNKIRNLINNLNFAQAYSDPCGSLPGVACRNYGAPSLLRRGLSDVQSP